MQHTREPRRVKELIRQKKRQEKEAEALRQQQITAELREIQILCGQMNIFLYRLEFTEIYSARFFLNDLFNYWKQNRKNKRG